MNRFAKLFLWAALLSPFVGLQAQTLLSDFSSSAGWGSSQTLVGSGNYTIAGGTANFTTGTPTAADFAYMQYTGAVGSYTSNWSVQINVNYNAPSTIFTSGVDQFFNMGLMVGKTGVTPSFSAGQPQFNAFLIESNLYLSNNNGLRDIRTAVFAPGSNTDDNTRYPTGNTSSVSESGSSSAAVRISFDATTKVLTGAYDATGGTSFTSIPTLTSNTSSWMTGSDTFSIYLMGVSGYDGATTGVGPAVGMGEAVIDGFYGSNLTAVPEPSTYAAIFGAAVLGLAAWRRKQRAEVTT